MAPSFEVREVRNGLFRIYWITDDSFDRYNSKTFQLCGSQSGRTFEISCKFEKCLASFNVREVSFSENSVSESTKSSEGNSGIQQPKRQKLGLNVLETEVDSCPPHHMWINYKNNTLDEKILYLKSSGIWSFSSTNGTGILFPDAITLSMDFGNISNGLAKLFRTQQLCDVEFNFKCGQSIGAHVAILSAGSPVFSVMFSLGFLESQTRKVAINDVEIDIFRHLLFYLYSGSGPKLKGSLEEKVARYQLLFQAADKYDVEALKTVCIDGLVILKKTFSSSINRLIFSQQHSISKLFENSMRYLVENSSKLCYQPEWLDFMKSHPDLCVLVTQRIADSAYVLTDDSE